MKRIALRDEDVPDDALVVVRGGEMNSDHVRRSAADAYDEFGLYSVSVFLVLDASIAELCRDLEELQRYGKVRPSTVGRLRSLGFALIPTFDRPHFDIVLPDLSDATLDRLELWLTDLTCHEARYVWRHHPGWRDELPGNVARAGGAVSIANPAVVSRFNAAHGTHATRYCKVWTRQRELATS